MLALILSGNGNSNNSVEKMVFYKYSLIMKYDDKDKSLSCSVSCYISKKLVLMYYFWKIYISF